MTRTDTPRHVRFSEARYELRAADLLLFQAQAFSPISSLIRVYGRGDFSHAAIVAFWDGVPMVLEFREICGSRAVTLKSQVEQYPGAIHVYRPMIGDEDAEAVADGFRDKLLGHPYAYSSILKCLLLRVPGLRLRCRADTRDACEPLKGAKDCSQGVSCAFRHFAHRDPVPKLADRFTEPSDLARADGLFRDLGLILEP